MDYKEYEKVYRQAVEKNLRHPADKATEEEWMVLSDATKNQIVKRLSQELANVLRD